MWEVLISWSGRADGISGSFVRYPVGVVLLLELDGAEVAEPFLDAPGVVGAVDVLDEREVGLG